MSDGVVAMSFVVQLRVCDANLKAYTAVHNAAWFQRRRIPRSIDFHRTSLRRRVAAMSLVFQLRVCSAHSTLIAALRVVFSNLSEPSCLSRAVRAW